ncbi:MAG: helix-turn-helix domain-containing protein [Microbacterium sp.]
MRDGIPIPGTARARLLDAALTQFGAHDFDDVAVTDLAARADVTTGSLYHHFGSKAGIYDAVRTDVERRLRDRMEGAAAVAARPVEAALLVGYDYLVRAGFTRLLSERRPGDDPIEGFLTAHADAGGAPVARLLLAAWREALRAASTDAAGARAALATVLGARD